MFRSQAETKIHTAYTPSERRQWSNQRPDFDAFFLKDHYLLPFDTVHIKIEDAVQNMTQLYFSSEISLPLIRKQPELRRLALRFRQSQMPEGRRCQHPPARRAL